MNITFCGHSDFKETDEIKNKFLSLLHQYICDQKADLFLGNYGLFDSFVYRNCKIYKENHPNVRLIYVTPYLSKIYRQDSCKKNYLEYDQIIYPVPPNVPHKYAISFCNRWMVENSMLLIAYIDHAWGGAYQTFHYAMKKRKAIENLGAMNV